MLHHLAICIFISCLHASAMIRGLHSFPTRRSSDLWFFEPGHTAAMFRARHMMVTYVRGHFKNVSGSLVFEVAAHIRDHHVRSEEHTSELQSRGHLVCRLLLEKKKKTIERHCVLTSA